MMTREAITDAEPVIRRVGANVRRIRQEKGLSLGDIDGLGVSQNTWWRVETGRNAATLVTLNLIAQALGVRLMDLVAVEGVDE